jgi:cytoskeletal protein CcmA (bactofilin family)
MWRKPNESKPSGQNQGVPPQAPSKPQVIATTQLSPTPLAVAAPEPPVPQNIAPPPAPVPVISKPVVTASVAPAVLQTSVPVSMSTSVISAGLKIRGEISGSSDLHIEGEAHGKIRLSGGRVSVGPNGNVQADVDAREIVVEGTLQGNLKATESVRLGPSSRVQGSVLAPRIGIDDGARLRGQVEMVRASDSRPVSLAAAKAQPAPDAVGVRAVSAGADSAASHA